MWKEAVGGISILSIMFLVIGLQNKRIEKKVNKDVCTQKHLGNDSAIKNIQEHQKVCQALFKEVDNKLAEQKETLIEMKTILSIAAKKNGWN